MANYTLSSNEDTSFWQRQHPPMDLYTVSVGRCSYQEAVLCVVCVRGDARGLLVREKQSRWTDLTRGHFLCS